jgi:multidrug efflux pump subunit AcrA (membrane-fusion protein)
MSEERHTLLAIHSTGAADPHELLQRQEVIRRSKITAAVVVLLLLLGGARTVFSQSQKMDQLKADIQTRSQINVKTQVINLREAGQTVALPGSLQGYVQSPIYARVPGYIKRWHKDIGARVRKGEVLAELETQWESKGIELVQVATGWRFQSRPDMREYLDRLHPEKLCTASAKAELIAKKLLNNSNKNDSLASAWTYGSKLLSLSPSSIVILNSFIIIKF